MGCGEIGGGEMSIEITPDLLSDLRQKAEAAGGKQWKVYEASDGSIFITGDDEGPHLAEVWWPKDANHIAAASPAVVLALVAEVERLRDRLDELICSGCNQQPKFCVCDIQLEASDADQA